MVAAVAIIGSPASSSMFFLSMAGTLISTSRNFANDDFGRALERAERAQSRVGIVRLGWTREWCMMVWLVVTNMQCAKDALRR